MKYTGGPAFPFSGDHAFSGMTLRDYFAAKAMQGLLSSGWCGQERELSPASGCREVAQDAYLMADAMLEARNKS